MTMAGALTLVVVASASGFFGGRGLGILIGKMLGVK